MHVWEVVAHATCLSCARAAQVKVGPSCHCKCLTFSKQFMCKIGKSAAQTVQNLQTIYGDCALQKNGCMCLVQQFQKWARIPGK